jgi:hypothetical protein
MKMSPFRKGMLIGLAFYAVVFAAIYFLHPSIKEADRRQYHEIFTAWRSLHPNSKMSFEEFQILYKRGLLSP